MKMQVSRAGLAIYGDLRILTYLEDTEARISGEFTKK